MRKKLKLMAAALTATVFMTGAASAITVLDNHNHHNPNPNALFVGSVFGQGQGVFATNSSVTTNILGLSPSLSLSWFSAITRTILSAASVNSDIITLRRPSIDSGLNQHLLFAWSTPKPSSGTSGGSDVAAVPLPAGGLLLLTALGGLALTRRRKAV